MGRREEIFSFCNERCKKSVMSGVQSRCLDINNTTELLELLYYDIDFELGPEPY